MRRFFRWLPSPKVAGTPDVVPAREDPVSPSLQRPRWHLDEPSQPAVLTRPDAVIRGWIVSADQTIGDVYLRLGEVDVKLATADRPDVRAVFPGEHTVGFEARVRVDPTWTGPAALRWRLGDEMAEAELDVVVDGTSIANFLARKRRKLDRVRRYLRCPKCGSTLGDEMNGLACDRQSCDSRFVSDFYAHDFIDDAGRAYGGVISTSNVSAHPYTPETQKVVDDNVDGLVLDAGAGFRPDYIDHVVNLDVVGYDSTDVLGIGERLPFADSTFDAVISIAVLEHVRHPFECASELERVLKPGGTLLAMVPFLQPFHGYPDHYYNMTSHGLQNLFERLDIEALYVPEAGAPIQTLTWFLDLWARGLPDETAAAFRAMTVDELIADPNVLGREAFAADLAPDVAEQIASVTCLIGRKRAS